VQYRKFIDYAIKVKADSIIIEENQPYLTLHGHIHETVDISGSFKDRIGDTLCLSVGNHDTRNELSILTFDLNNPEDVVREIV